MGQKLMSSYAECWRGQPDLQLLFSSSDELGELYLYVATVSFRNRCSCHETPVLSANPEVQVLMDLEERVIANSLIDK
jgi:hypothetical protein